MKANTSPHLPAASSVRFPNGAPLPHSFPEEELSSQAAGELLQQLVGALPGAGLDLLQQFTGPPGKKHQAPTEERRLHTAEAKYQALVEQIPTVTFMAPLDGSSSELYVSPQIEQLLGFSALEWLDDPFLWYRQLHPDDKERWTAEFARTCGAGEHFRAEFRFLARDGRVVWVHAEAKVVTDPQGLPLFLHGVAFDITERRLAEETLRQAHDELERRVRERTAALAQANEALEAQVAERRRAQEEATTWKNRYEAAVLASGQLLYDWDSRTNEVTYGGDCEKILGYSLAEMTGGLARWVELIHPDDRAAFNREIISLLATRAPAHLEYRVRRKDGSYILVQDDGCFFVDGTGSLTRMVGFLVDITERRRLEVQLRQAQKMEAVGQLAGGIAHDFNNLLTIVTGYSDLALARLGPDDSLRELLVEIRKAGDRAAALTQQLLAFGRRQMLAPRVMDLNALVADMDRMLQRLIGEDIALTTDLSPALRAVKADPGQIQQVILNLVVNARDAMPRGGQLLLRTADVTVDAAAVQTRPGLSPGSYVTLAVRDTGCGMTPEVRAGIFEPFFTTKEVGKGTGLGLATVYGIVKQSDGYIDVASVPGKGTTFTLYLPPVGGIGTPPAAVPALGKVPRGRETVLLVEDEPCVRALSRRVLDMAGYQVLEANCGGEAVTLAEQHEGPIDILVTDVVMPQMSGRELADRLISGQPGLKVLFVSGYTDDAVVRHGVLSAYVDFLPKPYTPRALASRVREVLDSSRTVRATEGTIS